MKYITTFFCGVALTGLIVAAQVVTTDNPPKAKMTNEVCSMVMPDVGERVILWLRPNGEGGLSLDWERHQVVGWGMVEVPPQTGAVNVPLSKD